VMNLVTETVFIVGCHNLPPESDHLFDKLSAARLLDGRVEFRSEIDSHLFGPLLRPQPDVARVAIKRLIARLRCVEALKARRFALDDRERRHHALQPRRPALRTSRTLAAPRGTHHHVRTDEGASGTFVLKYGHPIERISRADHASNSRYLRLWRVRRRLGRR